MKKINQPQQFSNCIKNSVIIGSELHPLDSANQIIHRKSVNRSLTPSLDSERPCNSQKKNLSKQLKDNNNYIEPPHCQRQQEPFKPIDPSSVSSIQPTTSSSFVAHESTGDKRKAFQLPSTRITSSIKISGSYEKIKGIGTGSFGKAILVKEKGDQGKYFVMKVIETTVLGPKERRDALNEVQDGRLCIVMDYADGGDLYKTISLQRKKIGRGFTEEQILRWITQATLALKYLHDKHILHRDLKSQNMFLMSSGRLRLGDFGIAKMLDGTIAFTRTQVGTPYYLSPEMCKNKPYSWAADIWSLGCILYELATLRVPFDAPNISVLLEKITRHPAPPLPDHYSVGLRRLYSDCMQREWQRRPSASEILLKDIIQNEIRKMLLEEQEKRRSNKLDTIPPSVTPPSSQESMTTVTSTVSTDVENTSSKNESVSKISHGKHSTPSLRLSGEHQKRNYNHISIIKNDPGIADCGEMTSNGPILADRSSSLASKLSSRPVSNLTPHLRGKIDGDRECRTPPPLSTQSIDPVRWNIHRKNVRCDKNPSAMEDNQEPLGSSGVGFNGKNRLSAFQPVRKIKSKLHLKVIETPEKRGLLPMEARSISPLPRQSSILKHGSSCCEKDGTLCKSDSVMGKKNHLCPPALSLCQSSSSYSTGSRSTTADSHSQTESRQSTGSNASSNANVVKFDWISSQEAKLPVNKVRRDIRESGSQIQQSLILGTEEPRKDNSTDKKVDVWDKFDKTKVKKRMMPKKKILGSTLHDTMKSYGHQTAARKSTFQSGCPVTSNGRSVRINPRSSYRRCNHLEPFCKLKDNHMARELGGSSAFSSCSREQNSKPGSFHHVGNWIKRLHKRKQQKEDTDNQPKSHFSVIVTGPK